jgi:hypothetical protein
MAVNKVMFRLLLLTIFPAGCFCNVGHVINVFRSICFHQLEQFFHIGTLEKLGAFIHGGR